MATGAHTALVRLCRDASLLSEQAAPAPVKVTVEMLDVPPLAFEKYAAEFGGRRVRVLPGGQALDVLCFPLGELIVEMTSQPRDATEAERVQLRLHLVQATEIRSPTPSRQFRRDYGLDRSPMIERFEQRPCLRLVRADETPHETNQRASALVLIGCGIYGLLLSLVAWVAAAFR